MSRLNHVEPPQRSSRSQTSGRAPLVRVQRRRSSAWLCLDSPKNSNALSRALLADLADALREAGDDPSVRSVVVTAAGSVFCSGADLSERRAETTGEDGGAVAPSSPGSGLVEVLELVARSPKPVVAAINGHVRAGGMGLVAACDLAIASNSASFAFSEVRVGVAPAIISVYAVRAMSRTALQRYALTGEVFGPLEARRSGLVSEVVAPEVLEVRVDATTDAIALGSPGAICATKKLLSELAELGLNDGIDRATSISDELFHSPDAREGIAAFLEKRSPAWVTTDES
ncbi:MAG: enoyl-CoA hydratase-related protein [Actinobacteria bacterium]|nr:enoyl-CoA hydratase-related protein [Actinomycetota bacterium]